MSAVRKFDKEWAPVEGRKDLKTFRWVPKTERLFNTTMPAMPSKPFGKGSGNTNRRMGATITHRQSNAWQGTRRSSRGMGLPVENFEDMPGGTPELPGGGAGPSGELGADLGGGGGGGIPHAMSGGGIHDRYAQGQSVQMPVGGVVDGQGAPNTMIQQPQAQHTPAAVKSEELPQAPSAPLASEATAQPTVPAVPAVPAVPEAVPAEVPVAAAVSVEAAASEVPATHGDGEAGEGGPHNDDDDDVCDGGGKRQKTDQD